MRLTVLGATNEDHTFHLIHPLRLKDSNPVSDHITLGGVSFNIAKTLEICGAEVQFLTAFDDDIASQFKHVIYEKVSKPSYYAVIDHDMEVAFAAMDGLKTVQGTVFIEPLQQLTETDSLIIDLNFETALLKKCLKHTQAKVYVEATSAHKVLKVKALTPFMHGLKLNELEAKVLTKTSTLEDALHVLESWPLQEIILTCGPKGAYVIRDTVTHYQDDAPFHSTHMSGVGDAFMAGYFLRASSPLDQIKNAMTLAYLTAQKEASTLRSITQNQFKKEKETRDVRILSTRPRSTQ